MINPVDAVTAVLDGVTRPCLGLSGTGWHVYSSFRPTPLFLANVLNTLATHSADLNVHLPLPRGISLSPSPGHGQLQLVLDDIYVRRARRVIGYVGEIQLFKEGCGTVFPPPIGVSVPYFVFL